MQAIVLVAVAMVLAVAVWRFLSIGWRSDWRTRRSGPANNWQNEGYMANQDGASWSEIDGTIASSAPPRRGYGGNTGN